MTIKLGSLDSLGSSLLLGALVTSLAGCSCSKREEVPKALPSALPGLSAPSGRPPATAPEGVPLDRVIRLPSGPVLEILPGEGVGAIRLGATASTIERLMSAPCEFKDEKACRYVGRAIEFFLDDKGFTNEIHIHRVERPTTPEGRTFGVFNGRMANGLTLMMIPSGVQGLIGPPLRTESVKDVGPAGTVEIHYYDGMRIEYDKLPPNRVVVGGIVLVKKGK